MEPVPSTSMQAMLSQPVCIKNWTELLLNPEGFLCMPVLADSTLEIIQTSGLITIDGTDVQERLCIAKCQTVAENNLPNHIAPIVQVFPVFDGEAVQTFCANESPTDMSVSESESESEISETSFNGFQDSPNHHPTATYDVFDHLPLPVPNILPDEWLSVQTHYPSDSYVQPLIPLINDDYSIYAPPHQDDEYDDIPAHMSESESLSDMNVFHADPTQPDPVSPAALLPPVGHGNTVSDWRTDNMYRRYRLVCYSRRFYPAQQVDGIFYPEVICGDTDHVSHSPLSVDYD